MEEAPQSAASEPGSVDPPFSRFSVSAREVLALAQESALQLFHKYIGTEHLLLGLLYEGTVTKTLASAGVEREAVESQVKRISGYDENTPVPRRINLTPRANKVLELALREALSLGHRWVTAEHILVGLCRENGGVAARILLDSGFDLDRARAGVQQLYLEGGPDHPAIRALEQDSLFPEPEQGESEEEEEEEEEEERDTDREEAPLEAIPTHADRPATRDELGRERLAEVLGERMRRVRGENTELPIQSWSQRRKKRRADADAARSAGSFMVHIHAPWGAGKSSFLNFLAADLRNREPAPEGRLAKAWNFLFGSRQPREASLAPWIVVEFSAWEHQRLTTPWWWLLAAIQRSCGRELWRIRRRTWAWFWIRDFGWRLWNARAAVLTGLLLGALALVAWRTDWFGASINSLSTLQTAVLVATSALALTTSLFGLARGAGRWLAIGSAEGAVRFLRRAHDPLGVYRRRFRWLVRSSRYPITVFIDDLDRCRPEYVVELLEGIQTLFADEPISYVVAADRDWLCQSFAQGYEEFEATVGDLGRPLGFLFLEKTFQISLELPPMSGQDRARYWEGLMRKRASPEAAPKERAGSPPNEFAKLKTQAAVERQLGSMLSQGIEEEQLTAAIRRLNAPDMQAQLEQLLREFAPLIENNPRSMKRLMNAYGIERDRILRDGRLLEVDERRQLVLLTILRLRWPVFADHLRRCPDDIEHCDGSANAPVDHEFARLFADPEVRRLFDGDLVSEKLTAAMLAEFPVIETQLAGASRGPGRVNDGPRESPLP